MNTIDNSVRVRYFAAARTAAGTSEEVLHLPTGTSVAELIDLITHERHGLSGLVQRCSLLLNGQAVHSLDVSVFPPAELDILPQFSGG